MGARTGFWLNVHELSLSYDNEGETGDERRANILKALEDMPPMARQEIWRELRYLLAELSHLNLS